MMRALTCVFVVLLTAFTAFGSGEPRANAIVRLLNSRASGSHKSYAEAAEIVAEDAAKGRILQQFVIALIADDPMLPDKARLSADTRKQYLEKSREKIRVLAETKGNALAWYLLSLENNDLTYLKRAADGDNVQALNAWGTIILSSALAAGNGTTNDVARSVKESFECFRKASEMGDGNGFYNLGMCYMNGYGCETDPERAFNCFRKASESGHPQAINNIGGFYRDGIVVHQNDELSAKWFKKSYDLGDLYGQFNWAMALLNGVGVKANKKAAAKLLQDAAEHGSAESMYGYGLCLTRGDGVDKDEQGGFQWLMRSARSGFPLAMDYVAHCYDLGIGAQKNANESMVWKIRARAARGDMNAASWLIQNNYPMY